MNRTIIITGAGSGIGAATARRLDRDGANVVLVGRTAQKLEEVVDELDADRSLVVSGDVSRRDDCDQVVAQAVDRFGGVDGLVCNAGVGVMGRIGEISGDDWQRALDIDLTGVYHSIRAAWDALRSSGGVVVNVSSVSGIGGDWGAVAYNAAKGGVTNMTRALALDFAHSGVRVNAVAPSLTRTEMTSGMFDDGDLISSFEERIPMGRPAEPEEVADVIAFLLGRDARFVNGVVLPVDGGLSASNGQPPLG